ncbi:MAG: TRAP transporter small permease [Endomicrobium sp.]|nr:TRAP transporter small permease [Endomicrobium sp.]
MGLLKKILGIDIMISGTAMIVLIAVTFFAVILRYCFNNSLIWGEEIQLICIIIVVFFGGAAGFRFSSHVAIDFIVDRLSLKNQRIAEIAIAVISSLILIYFGIQGWFLTHQMWVTERTTDILQIPYFIPYASFPIGCLMMTINLIISEYERLFNIDVQKGDK